MKEEDLRIFGGIPLERPVSFRNRALAEQFRLAFTESDALKRTLHAVRTATKIMGCVKVLLWTLAITERPREPLGR